MFPRKLYRIVYEYDGGQGVAFHRLNRKGKLSPGNIETIEEELSEQLETGVLIVSIFEMN